MHDVFQVGKHYWTMDHIRDPYLCIAEKIWSVLGTALAIITIEIGEIALVLCD